jgi:ribosomal protein S18 acetylase RimI-like enzyme
MFPQRSGSQNAMQISIREAVECDADSIAHVDLESRRAVYRGILPESYLKNLSIEENRKNWEDRLKEFATFVLLAEDSAGKLIGYVYAGRTRKADANYAGEVYAIYLLPSHQRSGIGRSLMRSAAERLSSNGIYSLLIWVLAANPARNFYEALGGTYLRSAPNHVAGLTLEGVAYGWKDTNVLRERRL